MPIQLIVIRLDIMWQEMTPSGWKDEQAGRAEKGRRGPTQLFAYCHHSNLWNQSTV